MKGTAMFGTTSNRHVVRNTTVVAIAATLLSAGLAGCASSATAATATAAHPAVAARITVGSASVNVLCEGTQTTKPTIILFAGEPDPLTKFASLQKALSKTTRVCSYDRLGEGKSSKPTGAQTLTDSAALLDGVLRAEKIKGKVVVTGHSLGGLVAATFAHLYPQRVAGVVLLDATEPSVVGSIDALIPATATGIAAGVREEVGAFSVASTNPELLVSHGEPVGSLGNIPLTVVQHGKPIYASVPTYGAALQTIWTAAQHQLAALSTNSKFVTATKSGHYIYEDQQALTIKLIENATTV
jgi:pimeloyl-ACP methyl ester carboxylesterase